MSKYNQVTTRQLQEIKRLNAAGENDATISKILGVAPNTVYRHRKRMGLDKVGRNKKTYTYTVYDAKTDQLLAFGTVEDCTKALGYKSFDSFYEMVSRFQNGRQKKYHVLKEAA